MVTDSRKTLKLVHIKKKKKSLEKCIDCRRPERNLTKRQVTLRYYPARNAECFRESERPPATLKFTPHLGYVTERSVNVVWPYALPFSGVSLLYCLSLDSHEVRFSPSSVEWIHFGMSDEQTIVWGWVGAHTLPNVLAEVPYDLRFGSPSSQRWGMWEGPEDAV